MVHIAIIKPGAEIFGHANIGKNKTYPALQTFILLIKQNAVAIMPAIDNLI